MFSDVTSIKKFHWTWHGKVFIAMSSLLPFQCQIISIGPTTWAD
jgi:hypothetical protein